MTRTLRNLAVTLTTGLALTACATGGADQWKGSSPAAPAAATVEVENRNWSDVTVYAVYGAQRVRLGTVTSMSTNRFRIPGQFLAQSRNLRLVADPVGSSERFVSHGMQVYQGQRVSFTVQNRIAISSVAVF